jgi:hypothetical protein
MCVVSFVFALFPLSGWGALSGDMLFFEVSYVGVEIGNRQGPKLVIYSSHEDYPLTVTWYQGDRSISWDGEGSVPASLSIIHKVIYTEPAVSEGEGEDEFIYIVADLTGLTLNQSGNLWARCVSSLGETVVWQYDGVFPVEQSGESPVFSSWMGVKAAYASGYTFSGRSDDAFLIADVSGLPSTAEFFAGETGDTSVSLGISQEYGSRPTPDEAMFPFPAFTVTETGKVWARINNGVGSGDTPTVTLQVLDSEVTPEFVHWYTVVSDVNSGSTIELRAELNLPIAAFEFRWYWGESGDTSEPIEIPSGLIGSSWIYFTVPSAERKFWARATAGAQVVDSPTAILRPVPISAPEIIDQPDDLVRMPEILSLGNEVILVAMGGDLTFEWFAGESGDESQIFEGVGTVPGGNGRRAAFIIPFTDEHSLAWCKISNSEGSVATRTVSAPLRSFDDLALSFVEPTRRYSIRERTNRPGANTHPDMFAVKPTVPVDAIELYQLVDSEWVLQGRDRPSGSYLTFPRYAVRWADHYDNPVDVAYASGTYRMRLFIGDDYIETEDLEFVNEILDPELAEHREFLSLLQSSGSSTIGGLIEAHVMMPTDYLPEEVSLLSVVDGAWAETEFEQFSDYVYRPDQSTDWNYYRRDILRFRWQPNGSPYYWLIVGRENGPDAVLRLPGSAGGSTVELPESGDPFEVVLPPGVAEIPLPKLPENVRWVFGSGDEGGAELELPFEPRDMPRNDVPLRVVDRVTGRPIANVGVRVRIDPEAPPALRDDAPQFVVDANNRLLWSGEVLGDVQRTRLYDVSGETPVELGEWVGPWTVGLPIPDGVSRARIEWDNDGKIQSMEAPVVRLPENFVSALGAERVDNDMAYSPKFGAFTKLRSYPWTFHGELGWTYLQPRPLGFHFFGLLADNGGGWYWTSPANFPFIYSYRTGGWEYYLMNSYGWVYNYSDGAWRKVAL